MSEPFLGEIKMVGFTFAPQGWAFCNGQLLSIAQNNALFALLGTTYGGDGVTTFALPDLRSRVPVHFGQGPLIHLGDLPVGETSRDQAERPALCWLQGGQPLTRIHHPFGLLDRLLGTGRLNPAS